MSEPGAGTDLLDISPKRLEAKMATPMLSRDRRCGSRE